MTGRWEVPPGPPDLPAGELHVWRAGLDPDEGQIAALQATLAPDERTRAERFRLPCDRRRFIAARGFLRGVLGQVLGLSPAELDFLYGSHGKPFLASSPLAFNLSHSGDLGLIALRRGEDVGVDIERIRDGWEWEGVANRFFCAAEIAWLHALPAGEQQSGFFTLWTRKEAYLKARGEGVWHDLRRVDVTQSLVREAGATHADGGRWLIEDLDPGGHCRAAVCVQGPLPNLRAWHWEHPRG